MSQLKRLTKAELVNYCKNEDIAMEETDTRANLLLRIQEHVDNLEAEDSSMGSVPGLMMDPQLRQTPTLAHQMKYEPQYGQPIVIAGETVDCKAVLKEISLDAVRVFFKSIEEYEHRYQRTISIYSYLSIGVVKQLKRENEFASYNRQVWTRV